MNNYPALLSGMTNISQTQETLIIFILWTTFIQPSLKIDFYLIIKLIGKTAKTTSDKGGYVFIYHLAYYKFASYPKSSNEHFGKFPFLSQNLNASHFINISLNKTTMINLDQQIVLDVHD